MAHTQRYDHYKVLGISRSADLLQVKQAFRERAKNCHPDRNPSPQASTVFQAVHQAYRVLIDPHSRARYDAELRYYRSSTTQTRAAQGPTPNRVPRTSEIRDDAPPQWWQIWAFRGLHLTGLLFGVSLTSTILVGLIFFNWPEFLLAFTAIGVGIIPESLEGLRQKA